jgi:hypothetical protein
LVQAFRHFIDARAKYFEPPDPLEVAVHKQLDIKIQESPFGNKQLDNERQEFFYQLGKAWDAVAFNRYEIGTFLEVSIGGRLASYYDDARRRGLEHPELISLNPTQVQIIDAMTEAVGIPHQRGQSEIPIPENVRGSKTYFAWRRSPEYTASLNAYMARQKREN